MAIKIDLSSVPASTKTDRISSAGRNRQGKTENPDNIVRDRVELSSYPDAHGLMASERNGMPITDNAVLQEKGPFLEEDRADYQTITEQINSWCPADFSLAIQCHNIDNNAASQIIGALMS